MDDQQRAYLLATYDLEPGILDRLVKDIWSFTKDTSEEWIQKRHSQLQSSGKRNEEIYAQIAQEVAASRFAAPVYTIRQIRRIIYG
jgi:hypothetical protein